MRPFCAFTPGIMIPGKVCLILVSGRWSFDFSFNLLIPGVCHHLGAELRIIRKEAVLFRRVRSAILCIISTRIASRRSLLSPFSVTVNGPNGSPITNLNFRSSELCQRFKDFVRAMQTDRDNPGIRSYRQKSRPPTSPAQFRGTAAPFREIARHTFIVQHFLCLFKCEPRGCLAMHWQVTPRTRNPAI